MPIRRALLSVSNKTGLLDFARALASRGVELLSTGGTYKALREANIPAQTVEAYTGNANLTARQVMTVTATATPHALTKSVGVAVSAGVSVGAALAYSTVSPSVSAYVGGASSTINAASLAIVASQFLPGGSDETAEAHAIGAAGGVLAGISGSMMPREMMPEDMRQLSLITPHAWALNAYAQLLSRDTPMVETQQVLLSCGVLTAFGVGFSLLAWRLLKLD